MIIEEIDISALPSDPEIAFVRYVRMLRQALEPAREADAKRFHGMNDEYLGNHSPDRFFVSSVIAFLDEYGIVEGELEDISDLPNHSFIESLPGFETRVNYLISRFHIRRNRSDSLVGTPAFIDADFKSRINHHLETVRKIIEQEISDQNKKDELLKKLHALQLEVNRDRTSFDALMQRIVDFSANVGVAGENIEPLIDKLERIKKLIFDGVRSGDAIQNPKRRKELPPPEPDAYEVDDDIPF